MVQRLLGGLGASFAFSAVTPAHPVLRHMINGWAMAHATAGAQHWMPMFFNSHQDTIFMALAEDIVPGSANVHVNRVVDLLLSVDTVENQQDFKASLAAMDRESLDRFGRSYNALSGAQRDEILALASTGKASDFEKKLNGDADPQQHQSPTTLRDHFENLKGWIVGVYYASEPGMRELGWTGNVFFSNFPGCQHEEQH